MELEDYVKFFDTAISDISVVVSVCNKYYNNNDFDSFWKIYQTVNSEELLTRLADYISNGNVFNKEFLDKLYEKDDIDNFVKFKFFLHIDYSRYIKNDEKYILRLSRSMKEIGKSYIDELSRSYLDLISEEIVDCIQEKCSSEIYHVFIKNALECHYINDKKSVYIRSYYKSKYTNYSFFNTDNGNLIVTYITIFLLYVPDENALVYFDLLANVCKNTKIKNLINSMHNITEFIINMDRIDYDDNVKYLIDFILDKFIDSKVCNEHVQFITEKRNRKKCINISIYRTNVNIMKLIEKCMKDKYDFNMNNKLYEKIMANKYILDESCIRTLEKMHNKK